jgi:hypothetical protein
MRRSGWYRLPRSGTPFHGPIPDGAEEIPDPTTGEENEAASVVGVPDGDDELEVVLAGTIEQITEQADSYPVETVRRLIESEYAGRNRSTLLERLDRIAKRLEETPPGD